jgi:hypothetical protein
MSPIERDPLAQELAGDPATPPRLVAFIGWVGDSNETGRVRLYLDEELREWFDVAEDEVVRVERRDAGAAGSTVLWVDERTTLYVRQAQPQDVHGEYLRGDVAAVTVPQTAAFLALDAHVIYRTPAKW